MENEIKAAYIERSLKLLNDIVAECAANPSDDPVVRVMASQFGDDFNKDKLTSPLPHGLSERMRTNLLTAYGLIFALSGKYPCDIWGDEICTYNSIIVYKEAQSKFITALSPLNIPMKIKGALDDRIRFVEYGLRGTYASRLLSISALDNANIAELLSDAVFFKNKTAIVNRTPEKWLASLIRGIAVVDRRKKFLTDEHIPMKNTSLHAVSLMGENHIRCDDFCGVRNIDNDAWFAFSSDGVGSCDLSYIGAKNAAESFYRVISVKKRKYKKNTGEFMKYIKTGLARDVYKKWAELNASCVTDGDYDMSRFAATFLFAFGCSGFIACGILGDGEFIIEKRLKLISQNTPSYGYIKLTDGYSGVVQTSVVNMKHLLHSPSSLEIKFFSPDEVSGIWLSSDGGAGITFSETNGTLIADLDNITNAAPRLTALREADDGTCAAILRDYASRFSAANNCFGGRGDDCSIVYVKNGRFQ